MRRTDVRCSDVHVLGGSWGNCRSTFPIDCINEVRERESEGEKGKEIKERMEYSHQRVANDGRCH